MAKRASRRAQHVAGLSTETVEAKLPGALCAECSGLHRPMVPSEPAPSGKPKLIVIGEGPGQQELEEKRPFVGRSGRFLERQWKQIGLKRSDLHICNAVACDVPKDNKEAEFKVAVKCCAPRVRLELEALPDDVPVATMGAYALQTAMGWTSRKPIIAGGKKKFGFRGSVIDLGDPVRKESAIPRLVLPLLHPAFVLRADIWAPIFDTDMERVGRILKNGYKAPEHLAGKSIVIVQSIDELRSGLARLGPRRTFDIETNGLNLLIIDMVCFVLSDQNTAVVVPWTKTQVGEGNFFNGNQPLALQIINEFIATGTTVGHNLALFDSPVAEAERHGIKLTSWEDTLIGYHVLTSQFPKALSHVVSCFVDAPPWKHWDHNSDFDRLLSYCAQDGLYTSMADPHVFKEFDEWDWKTYESDKRSAILAREMTQNGFALDVPRAQEMSAALRIEEDKLCSEAAQLSGISDLNVFSPKQLQKLFFGKLGAHVCFWGKSGEPTLDVDALRAYATSANQTLAAMSELVLKARRVRKCRSTYVDKVLEIRHTDDRIHAGWISYGTETGRWACRGPNLANLPRPENDPAYRLGLGGIRSLYIPGDGRRLVAFDVGQAEFRVAAYYSNDPNMIQVCESSDVHSANAELLFGAAFKKAEGDQRKMLRTLAKTSGFAVCYLAEAPTVHARLIASGIKITLQQVEAMIDSLKMNFRVYYAKCADNLSRCIRTGYVESPILRRKRWLGHAPEPPKVANFPIQSGTADVFNERMWEIRNRIIDANLDAPGVAAVYDAGYFDVVEHGVDRLKEIIKDVWARPVTIGDREFVLPIDLHAGMRWSEL